MTRPDSYYDALPCPTCGVSAVDNKVLLLRRSVEELLTAIALEAPDRISANNPACVAARAVLQGSVEGT